MRGGGHGGRGRGGSSDSDEITGKIFDSKIIRKLFGFFRPYFPLALVALLMVLASSLMDLIGPLLFKKAIDVYIPAKDFTGLRHTAIFYLVITFFTSLLFYLRAILAGTLGQNVVYDIRAKLYSHLLRLSVNYFGKNPIGRLTTRVTNDVESLNELFTAGFIEMFADIFTIVFILVIAFKISVSLTLVTLLITPVMLVAVTMFRKFIQPAYLEIRRTLAELNAELGEDLGGMKVIKAFTEEKRTMNKLKTKNKEYLKANERSVFVHSVFFPVVEILESAALAIIVWFGGGRLLKADPSMTAGTLFAFLLYFRRIYRPINDLAQKFNIFQNAVASSARIFNILDSTDFIPDTGREKIVECNEIELKDISFSYGKEEVLQNINFKVRKGEKVALVGHTGSGKSTIINLLLRFWDVEHGQLLIDGKGIKEYALGALRKKFGLVPQDIYLFEGTVFDNIVLENPDISKETVEMRAEEVGLTEILKKFPKGLYHTVAEEGKNLSLGERQLISFARIMVYDPDVLILDEPTSNIDTETEELIQKALERVLKGRSAIMVAHRLSTIKTADRIVVLSHGKIVEQGTHQELLKNKEGHYYKLYLSQS